MNSKKYNNLIFLNYSPELEKFLFWCQQLIAESLGKKGKGILPTISLLPRDNHSLMQLYLDGFKNNFFTFFFVKDGINKNKHLNNILEAQYTATKKVFKKKKIPFRSFCIKKRNEETLGELFSYFVLETVFLAENLKINPFNQPAVEQLKIITKQNLFKKIQK